MVNMDNIKIIVTSDIHGNIFDHQYSDNKKINSGISKIATMLNKERTKNTVLIDNGDLIQGSPLTLFHDLEYKNTVSPMSTCLNLLQYDFYNLGNHDFNFGKDTLFNHINTVNAQLLTTNVLFENNYLSKDYQIKVFDNGIKIAFIGAVTNFVEKWEKVENLEGFKINDAFESMKKSCDYIKANNLADYIVGVYHGGFETDLVNHNLTESDTGENQGSKMCREIDNLDILLTGHQHRSIATTYCNTVVTQTACNASEVAIIEINPCTKKIECKLVKMDYETDVQFLNNFNDIESKLQEFLDVTLGSCSNIDLSVKNEFDARLNKHPLVSFLNQVIIDYAKVDLSSVSLFDKATGFNADITMRDLVSTYVYPNTVVIKEINKKYLMLYLEKCASYFSVKNDKIVISDEFIYPKLQNYNYDMVDGIEYTINASNPKGQKIVDLTYQGKPIDDDKVFTLALSNYRATAISGFEFFNDCKTIIDTQKDMVELLQEYILLHKQIIVEHHDNIKVIK